jgi:hypothetical protein
MSRRFAADTPFIYFRIQPPEEEAAGIMESLFCSRKISLVPSRQSWQRTEPVLRQWRPKNRHRGLARFNRRVNRDQIHPTAQDKRQTPSNCERSREIHLDS